MRTDWLVRLAFILVTVFCTSQVAAAQVDLTYIGNEGFLLEGGGKKVLIDALVDEGIEWYESAPDSLRTFLNEARPPYNGIDLILVTHDHADHFGPRATVSHLRSNPKARLISSPQVVNRLKEFLGDEDSEISERIEAVLPERNGSLQRTRNGVDVQVLDLHHGRTRRGIQNLGYLITLGGLTALHVGDTEADADDFRVHGLQEKRIDIAMLPSWYLRSEPYTQAMSGFEPGTIVAMHIAREGAPAGYFGGHPTRDASILQIEKKFPGTLIAIEPGARWTVTSRN